MLSENGDVRRYIRKRFTIFPTGHKEAKSAILSMFIGCRQIVSLSLLTGLLSQIACLHRHQITATGDGFHLESVKDDSLLMSPPLLEAQPVNKPMKIRSETYSLRPDHRSECRAEVGAFKIEPQSGSSSIQIEMPTPGQWMEDLEGRRLRVATTSIHLIDFWTRSMNSKHENALRVNRWKCSELLSCRFFRPDPVRLHSCRIHVWAD